MATKIWYGAAAGHTGEIGWGLAQISKTIDNAAAVDKGGGKEISRRGHPRQEHSRAGRGHRGLKFAGFGRG